MHEYDTTLKSLLMRLGGQVMAELTGFAIASWHNVELPAVRHRRADLLGETSSGRLVHIELQSTNQSRMTRRMLEYSLAIDRRFRRFPEQIVLYVGNAPLRMKSRLTGPGLSYECRFLDIRDLDSEPLLASPSLDDNVLGILMRLGNEREAVRRVLNRIAAGQSTERGLALAEFMILAGLRKLGSVIETEIEQMPILDDIMDHEVLGRERKRGIALGLAEGRIEGRVEGRVEGERRVILRLIGKRFGAVPEWARKRIDSLVETDLERIELRLLEAPTVEDLFA